MKKLLKSIETIALCYLQGNCSVDTLIKACDQYKIKSGLIDDFDYDLKVTKSCIDYINGVSQDEEIIKAIIPGQTKVIDGVMYIYSKTKDGSKTEYGWHVVRKGAKTSSDIGRGSKLNNKSIQSKQKYINDLFPNDLSALKEIKRLGGSTGAKLMEDADGNQYVMKKGSNTNSEHVKSEYLSNQLYNVLGLRTPDYELYDNGGEKILLSRFIQGTHIPNSSDFAKMSQGFIADILLANWDVYQNDNCLIKNANGDVYRVDNGGCLDFRAKGGKKTFDADVYDTWKSMSRYNPGISNLLSEDDQLNQINEILKKKDDVVNFLMESGEDKLSNILSQRFDGLKKISDELNEEKRRKAALTAAKLSKIIPRTLKSEDEMYADFNDEKIKEILQNSEKKFGIKINNSQLLYAQGDEGWGVLSEICKERGFDARPLVVDEDKFWELRKKTKYPMMLRGFDSVTYADNFKYNDNCYFGKYGVWGQGIYAHSDDKSKGTNSNDKHSDPFIDNKSNKTNWKQAEIYRKSSESAFYYANSNEDAIVKMVWTEDANIVNSEDLLDEIKSNFSNLPALSKLNKELDEIKGEWTKNEIALMNIKDTIKMKVFEDIGYDENAVNDLFDTLNNTNWGARNAQGKRSYPMFDEMVLKTIKTVVEKCGGSLKIVNKDKEDEQARIEIGDNTLWISKYSWNHNAVKQKNQFTNPYHYQAERFVTFFDTNCVKRAEDALQKEISNGKMADEFKDKVNKSKQKYYDKKKECDDELSKITSSNDIYARIFREVRDKKYRSSGGSKSLLGIYAALKGYDGIYQPDGNSSGHGFVIILNRSKIITSI